MLQTSHVTFNSCKRRNTFLKVKFLTLLWAVGDKCIKPKVNADSLKGSDCGLFLFPTITLVLRLRPGP